MSRRRKLVAQEEREREVAHRIFCRALVTGTAHERADAQRRYHQAVDEVSRRASLARRHLEPVSAFLDRAHRQQRTPVGQVSMLYHGYCIQYAGYPVARYRLRRALDALGYRVG